jgi:hypothetical protein
MHYNKRIKIKRSDTPVLIEYEDEGGVEIPYEMKAGSKRGLFLNSVPLSIWKFIRRI